MSTDFTGQIAIVTGAAAGIGHTIAARLAEQGARIVGVDIAPALADAIGGLPGEGHLAVSANIADASAGRRRGGSCRRRARRPDHPRELRRHRPLRSR